MLVRAYLSIAQHSISVPTHSTTLLSESGGRGGHGPPHFGRSIHLILTRGQIMPITFILTPPDFQTFLRPCTRFHNPFRTLMSFSLPKYKKYTMNRSFPYFAVPHKVIYIYEYILDICSWFFVPNFSLKFPNVFVDHQNNFRT